MKEKVKEFKEDERIKKDEKEEFKEERWKKKKKTK